MTYRLQRQIILISVFFFSLLQAQAAVGYKVGDIAPEFALKSLKDKNVSLSYLRNKGHVLLVFWAVECVYCYAHIKVFNRAYEQYTGRLTVAAINIAGEYKSEVADYVKDNKLKYLILSDRLNNIDVAELYNVRVTPTLVLISPEGKVLYYGHRMPELNQWLK